MTLKAPFPWFGGKSRVAHLVWDRFGDVTNYVEPFAGSLAVLLARPHEPRVETVNDIDCHLSNFWRAVARDPAAVAEAADWPINEADLHARHRWLVAQAEFRERMKTDPGFYDAKIAGWWVWGISQWIGSGWCQQPEWTGRGSSSCNRGSINTTDWNGRPDVKGMGVHAIPRKRPNLGGHGNKGVHGVEQRLKQQIPDISGSRSRLALRREALDTWFGALQERLRNVRVCCGDWKRILGPSPTIHIGLTAVFLDPPYAPVEISRGAGRHGFAKTDKLYGEHEAGLSAEVRTWALEHGDDPKLRIAMCGYEGEHDMPSSWTRVAWVSQGGYSNRGKNPRRNAGRERIWFSPHCLAPAGEGPIFAKAAGS